jgi:hypothetical protein
LVYEYSDLTCSISSNGKESTVNRALSGST